MITVADAAIDAIAKPSAIERVPAARVHLNFLDGLRALAALFVVFHHAWLTIFPNITDSKYPSGTFRLLFGCLIYGHFAVACFIVISGYSLMLSVTRNDGILRDGALGFLIRRVKRILPPFYFALLLSLVLIVTLIGQTTGTHWDISLPATPSAVLANIFMVGDVFHIYKINHAFWSIFVEFQIYLLFPALVLLWKRFGAATGTLLTILAAYCLYFALHRTPFSGITPHFLALFGLGMLAAVVTFSSESRWQSLRERFPLLSISAVCFAITAFLCYKKGTEFYLGKIAYLDFIIGIGMFCLLVAGTQSRYAIFQKVLSMRPLVFIGGISFSLYLIHAPLLQIVWQYMLHPLHMSDKPTFVLLALIGTAFCLAGAYIFYLVCEKPWHEYSKSLSHAS